MDIQEGGQQTVSRATPDSGQAVPRAGTPDIKAAMTVSVNANNKHGLTGPSTTKAYTKYGGGAGFRPSHFEKDFVTRNFGNTQASATIGGYLKSIANYLSGSPYVDEDGNIAPYDSARYRNAWHAMAPDAIAASVDEALAKFEKDDVAAPVSAIKNAIALPVLEATRGELSAYADPDKLDKLSKTYAIVEYRGMNRVTPTGSDLCPEPSALTLMKHGQDGDQPATVVNLYGFERGKLKDKEFVGLTIKGDMVGLVKQVDFRPETVYRRQPSGASVPTTTVRRVLNEDGYLTDPKMAHPDGIYPAASQDDIVALMDDMAKLGYKPRFTTPDDRVIYPEIIKGDRVEALASRGILTVAQAVSAGAVDAAIAAVFSSKEDAEAAMRTLANPKHRDIANHFKRILEVGIATNDIDPEEVRECLMFAANPMRAMADYHELYWKLIDEGLHADPIYYLKGILVDVLDLDRACDPKNRGNGMVTSRHISDIKNILATRTVEQLIPDYKDPLVALGLDDKIPQSKRMDMVMAILCSVAEYVHDKIEKGEIHPSHSIYMLIDKDGQKVRKPIARDPHKDPELPDNQVTWPNTKTRRYLTCVDKSLKPVLDQSLQPLTKAYNMLREATNRAMLELTLKRALRADKLLSPDKEQTPDRVNEIRDMVRAHLFGFKTLDPVQRSFMEKALGTNDAVGAWMDEMKNVLVLGPMLSAIRERITPEYQQREAFQYARDLEAQFGDESKGMKYISMFPVSTYSAPINPTNVYVAARDEGSTFTVYEIARPPADGGDILPPALIPVSNMQSVTHEEFVRFRIRENVNNAYISIVQTLGSDRMDVNEAGMPIQDTTGGRTRSARPMGHTEALMRRLGTPVVTGFHDPIAGVDVNAAIFSLKVINSGITGMAPTSYRFLFNKGGDPLAPKKDVAMVPKRLEQLCLDEQEFCRRNKNAYTLQQGLVAALTAQQGAIVPRDWAPLTADDINQLAQDIVKRRGLYRYDTFGTSIEQFERDRILTIRTIAAYEASQAMARATAALGNNASAAMRSEVQERLQQDQGKIKRDATLRETGAREFCRFARGFEEQYKSYAGPWYGAVPDGSGLAKADIRLRFADVRDIASRIYELQCGSNVVCKPEFIAIEED